MTPEPALLTRGVQSGAKKRLVCSEWAQCEFPPDLDLGREALHRLMSFCQERGLAADFCREVELAVTEAITNAIRHGCVEHPDGTVRTVWKWVDETIEIRVTDPGSFSPLSDAHSLPKNPLAESGRGLFLMSSVMDQVEHRRVTDGHELILRKKVGPITSTVQTLDQLQKTVETMAEDLHVTYKDFSALLRLSENLATAHSFDAFAAVACTRLRELLPGVSCTLRLLRDDGRLEMIYGENQRPTPLDLERSRSCVEMEVAKTSTERHIADVFQLPLDDPLYAAQGSAFVDPVLFQNKLLGVLSVVRAGGNTSFNDTQANFVRSVSDFLGIALTTLNQQGQRSLHQRALRELEIAATIQTSLQPREFPENSNYRLFGISRSAAQVGGDYFDVLPVRNVGALLVIADVMGKGVPAALLATIFRTAVHCRLDLATRPGLLLRAVNQQINSDLYHLDMFITAQVAYLCYETHRIFLAHAGHCPLLRFPGSQPGQPTPSVERHGAQGYPLGIGGDVRFKESTISVQPGDRYLFLTDGLYELEDAKGEMLGLDRLTEEASRLWSGTPEQFCGDLFDFLSSYSQGAPAPDDRTVLIIQRAA